MSIGVVIPVFRNESTIVRCLESIRTAAGTAHVEVHVVLDGNEDDSGGLVTSWRGDSGVHVVLHEQEHTGIAAARNRGLAAVEAPWVTFLDADDEITPARLSSPRVSRPFFGLQELHAEGGARLPAGTQPGITPYLMSLVVPTLTLREIGGFDSTYSHGDDLDLMIRLQEAGDQALLLPEVFVLRHIHADNASWNTTAVTGDYLAAVRQHLVRKKSGRGG